VTDLLLAAGWSAALVIALVVVVALHRSGLPTTYARDLLHVGAGVWIVGWPWWSGALWPIAITVVAALVTAAVPWAASRLGAAARLHDTVTGGDETWDGLVLYTATFAALTAIGQVAAPVAAAAAILALALGDGVGGAVGRRWGRIHFRAPGGKRKSVEGSVTVAVMAALGAATAGWVLGAPLGAGAALTAGVVAAVIEAAAPRGTDNLLVPAAVWTALLAWP